MRKFADSFRSAVQDMSAFILLQASWQSITIYPIVVIVVTAWHLLTSKPGVDRMYLIMVAFIIIVLLFSAWFDRWLARGIIQGKKARIAFSSLTGIILSIILILSLKSIPSASYKLQIGLWAAVSFLFGFGLFLLLFKKVSIDEA